MLLVKMYSAQLFSQSANQTTMHGRQITQFPPPNNQQADCWRSGDQPATKPNLIPHSAVAFLPKGEAVAPQSKDTSSTFKRRVHSLVWALPNVTSQHVACHKTSSLAPSDTTPPGVVTWGFTFPGSQVLHPTGPNMEIGGRVCVKRSIVLGR